MIFQIFKVVVPHPLITLQRRACASFFLRNGLAQPTRVFPQLNSARINISTFLDPVPHIDILLQRLNSSSLTGGYSWHRVVVPARLPVLCSTTTLCQSRLYPPPPSQGLRIWLQHLADLEHFYSPQYFHLVKTSEPFL
jgi:hypothetical protein